VSFARCLCVASVCLWLAACAALDERKTDTLQDSLASESKILVMLRMPPPHFRPDVTYASQYGATFGNSARRRIADDLAHEYRLKLVTSWPMPALGVDCFVMMAPANEAVADITQRIALDPRVESVEPMQRFEVLAHNDPLYPLQPAGVAWRLSDVHRVTTGRNVRIAEVDTGVELDHPDLSGQIALSRNFVDGNPYTAEAHGTAVAGIMVARADDGIGIAGVAPGARLLALRACWQPREAQRAAACNSFTLAKALQFALEQNVRIINLSLGGPQDRLLARLLDVALARGIAVVTAIDPSAPDGGFPASHPGVFAVASEAEPAGAPNAFLAPGRDIPTSTPHHAWTFVSGSSYAAAHVAGVIALLLEIAPNRNAWQLRDALASPKIADVAREHRHQVDACAAVARTAGACACSCTASHDAASISHR